MSLKFASGQQLAFFFRTIQEIAIRRILTPEKMAVWNLINIIGSAFVQLQASVYAASSRLLSQLEGANAACDRLIAVRGNSIYLEIFQQTILSCALLLIAPLVWKAPEELGCLLYYCAAAVMAGNSVVSILVALHEASGKFDRLGAVLPLNAILQAGLVYVGAYYYALPGLVSGAVLGLCLNILCMFGSLRLLGLGWLSRPDSAICKDLGGVAVSFRLADLPTSVFYVLDTLLASFWLKPYELGLYMTARLLMSFSSQIPTAINRVGLIKLGNKIGAKESQDEIASFVSRQFIQVYLFILVASVAVFEPVYRWSLPVFLPAYADTLQALPYMMLLILTSGGVIFIRNYWVQKELWRKICISGLVGLIGAIFVFVMGSLFFKDIGVSEFTILIFVGQLPYAFFLIIDMSLSLGGVKHLIWRLISFLLSLTCVALCLWINGSFAGEGIISFSECLKMIGLGLVVCAPFMFAGRNIIRMLAGQYITK